MKLPVSDIHYIKFSSLTKTVQKGMKT